MKHIGDLFLKYQKTLIAPQASVEKVCIEVIQEVTNFSLEMSQVEYTVSTKTLHLHIPSILKQEIRLKQETILNALKMRLNKHNCPETIL